MSYKVEAIPNFKKEAKQLSKKFHSLKNELTLLEEALCYGSFLLSELTYKLLTLCSLYRFLYFTLLFLAPVF